MILIGTAGYSYEDWKGVFYPEKIDKKAMLSFYAREFDFTEVNSTYYRMPNRHMFYRMQEKTPPDFYFVIKAYKGMTHERENNEVHFLQFREALVPLQEVGKLGCVLAQFPSSFRNSDGNRDYLRRCRELLPDIPIVVEFRHRGWIQEDTFELLEEEHLGYVCVDEPVFRGLVPPITRATTDTGYVRFHGRNYEKWWAHEEAYQRYDYLYREDELEEWVPRISDLEDRVNTVFVSMNNHYRGQAVINGRMLRELLARRPGKAEG